VRLFSTALLLALPLCLNAFSANIAQGQQATVRLSTSHEEVRVGQRFRIQLRIDAEGAGIDDITEPDLSALQMLGRSTSQPIQFSFGFGNRQTTVQQSRVIDYVVAATQSGVIQVGPVTAQVGGRTFHSQRIAITATGSGQPGAPTPAPGMPGGKPPVDAPQPDSTTAPTGALDGAVFDPEAFLRVVVDNSTPFVGEQVTSTVYLYTRVPLGAAPSIAQQPNTDGFWTQDLLPSQRTLQPHSQSVNGVPFNVYLLRRFAAFGLRAGDLEIGQMTVRIVSNRGFGRLRGSEPLTRVSLPTAIQVQPVPEAPGEPQFVGQVSLNTRADRTRVSTGDAVTVTVTARARSGNIRDLRLTLPETEGLRILEPRHQDEINHPNDRVGGTRTTEWLVVPLTPGTHELPQVQLHAFDPITETWSLASTERITLAARGEPQVSPASGDGDSERATEGDAAAANDGLSLPPQRRSSSFERGVDSLADRPWFGPLFGLGPAMLLLTLLFRRLRRGMKETRDDPARLSERAIRQRMKAARDAATRGERRDTYAQCSAALTAALDAKCSEMTGGLPRPDLRSLLLRDTRSEEDVETVLSAMARWDSARFSPSQTDEGELDEACAECARLLKAVAAWHAEGDPS